MDPLEASTTYGLVSTDSLSGAGQGLGRSARPPITPTLLVASLSSSQIQLLSCATQALNWLVVILPALDIGSLTTYLFFSSDEEWGNMSECALALFFPRNIQSCLLAQKDNAKVGYP